MITFNNIIHKHVGIEPSLLPTGVKLFQSMICYTQWNFENKYIQIIIKINIFRKGGFWLLVNVSSQNRGFHLALQSNCCIIDKPKFYLI